MVKSATPSSRTASPSTPRRGLQRARTTVIVLVAALVVVAGALLGLRAARSGVLPGVLVDGVRVGGQSEAGARAALQRHAETRGAVTVRALRRPNDGSATRTTPVMARASELGYFFDVDATVAAALQRGRQSDPLLAVRDHLTAFTATIAVPPVEQVRDDPLRAWAKQVAERLELPPREGRVRINGARVRGVRPRPGARVLQRPLVATTRERLLAGDGGALRVETEPLPPRTTAGDVRRAVRRARRAVSAPIMLRRNGVTATLTRAEIGDALTTRIRGRGDRAAIRIAVDPKAVRNAIGRPTISSFESDPENAYFAVSDGSVQVVGGKVGFVYDAAKAARQVERVASRRKDRSAVLAGDITQPRRPRAEVEALNIGRQVSSFTTYHACCESRVTNIHRMADIVDGAVIEPGETFSLNGYVGDRTTAKGFVAGGAILDGEFVEQVGGGVSQFTTTMYNAAYFGGYDIVEHKAHSYYISRYPEGREATLNYPTVDLKIANTSPHGILVKTSYSDTSITVSFYGKKWVQVSTTTGPRSNLQSAQTQYQENDTLRRGQEVVVQEAGQGFDVVVTRTLRFPDGRVETEDEFTRYLPQPRIVERNTP
jgi:vancomycin resistance protein YoaR